MGFPIDPAAVTVAYERLITRFARWAESQSNVRAAIVIGSRARVDHAADAWADLDVIIVADDSEPLVRDGGWLREVGECSLDFIETSPAGIPERRALFAGGLDADFALVSTSAVRAALDSGETAALALAVGRGMRVLIDRDGLAVRLAALKAPPSSTQPPAAEEFANTVADFWYHAVWTAKHLRRGELWWAKGGCDGHLKGLLQQMLEWHARAKLGPGHDTWFRGRFLEEWADPQAVSELRHAFAHYDVKDAWRALGVTMDLFSRIAPETAAALGFAYNRGGEEAAVQIVRQLAGVAAAE
jgi:aminoglycoside 6-adenylyltransferase